MKKIIVAGSRDFNNYNLIEETLDQYLSDKNLDPKDVEIVSGCARGADTLGEQYAKNRGIPVAKFPADWGLYGKSAGFVRNSEMAKYGNVLFAFYADANVKSKGTSIMIKVAKQRGLEVHVIEPNTLLKEEEDNSYDKS